MKVFQSTVALTAEVLEHFLVYREAFTCHELYLFSHKFAIRKADNRTNMSSTYDSEPLDPSTTLSTNNLTYGVELEFVFAFHEDLIRFPRDANYTTVKCLPYSTRQLEKFSRVNCIFAPNKVYNSWGVESSVFNSSAGKPLNPWKTEPLQIVADILQTTIPSFAGLYASEHLSVLDTLDNNAKKQMNWDNRKQWKITKDHSVCGVGSQNLQKWLLGKEIQVDKWDSLGVELISPVLDSNTPNDIDRIGKIVDALRKSASKTGAFITNQCGLHVHVQGPDASQFQRELHMSEDDAERHKARVWAKFALLLLVYEDEIARLHPPCRRPGHPNAEYQFQSNRLGFMKEDFANIFPNRLVGPEIPTSIQDCIRVDCSTRAISQKATIPDLRHGLSEYLDADTVALMNWPKTARTGGTQKPYRGLGDKDRQVNMTYLMRTPNLPQTIEFRQAKGSLNGQDISRWVEFCIGLVRLAHLYAADPVRFRVRNWRDVRLPDGSFESNRVDVFDLMRDMNLSSEAIAYWEMKVATYRGYRNDDEHDRLDDEVPQPERRDGPGDGSDGPSIPSKRPREGDEVERIEEDRKKEQRLDQGTAALVSSFLASMAGPVAPTPLIVPTPRIVFSPPAIQGHYNSRQENPFDDKKYYCPDEPLVFDVTSWRVLDFDSDKWMRMKTDQLVTVPSGNDRQGVCPCNALVQAMDAQYPDSEFAQTEAYALLPFMDEVFGGRAINITDDQFVQVLRKWTNGRFNLVHITPDDHHQTAKRTGTFAWQETWGYNLYVRHRPARDGRRDHWESLRKATEEERAENVRRSRAGISRGPDFI
ncbi:hypothetical protein VTL71DRAFT_13460 [Oculimacula yallundae]|uniref:Amidoligase enzyme-domain-containing protein n=1 Tax=Oculimacula yallundae TaxID=86028 RepID=A0ABR4CKI5_9HELO